MDYLDLNKRTLNLSEIFTTRNGRIDIKLYPKAMISLFSEKNLNMREQTDEKEEFISIEEIYNSELNIPENNIYSFLSQELSEEVSAKNIDLITDDIENKEFTHFIEQKFSKERVIEILKNIQKQYSLTKKRNTRY